MAIAKKIFIGFGIFILVVAGGGLYGFLAKEEDAATPIFRKLKIGAAVFQMEIVGTSAEQTRGLSGREKLEENQGMLFIFPNKAVRSFWMAGMKFPLDIIWISGNKIIGISENLPPATAMNAPIYSSPEPVDKVLEINAGLAEKLGIKVGDIISL